MFAPRPGAEEEDDGVVLTMGVKDHDPCLTELLVLSGRDLSVVARAAFRTLGPVTPTFHGVYRENGGEGRVFT